MVETRNLYLTWSWIGRDGRTDRQTDRRTDKITAANTRYSYASSRA